MFMQEAGIQVTEMKMCIRDSSSTANDITIRFLFRRVDITGIDDISYKAAAQQVDNFIAAFAQLCFDTGTDAMFTQEISCTLCCLNIKAQMIEAANQRQCFFLIGISQCHKDSTIIGNFSTGSLQ